MSNSDQLMIFSFVFAGGISFLLFSGWLFVREFKSWLNDGR